MKLFTSSSLMNPESSASCESIPQIGVSASIRCHFCSSVMFSFSNFSSMSGMWSSIAIWKLSLNIGMSFCVSGSREKKASIASFASLMRSCV